MERRDFLKDKIEQVGRVLGKMIANFMGAKSQGNTAQGIEISNQYLQTELDIDIDQILKLEKEDLKSYLTERNLTAEHLETLVSYLIELGDYHQDQQYYQKAIILNEIADEISNTLSLMRMGVTEQIKMKMNQ
ncbi:hypothetical protein [Sediminitomix flava]|uniref:Uncharacterized protein n=1 Tax=Sediminitomix flava TaxID=379075 RepID=A0A315ZF75_SEDFL|nr:hypothetical protein [Sediminitomix flava]PWJ43809.1 hypothetical protein BC781_101155 [Sediminitomix flava]